MEAEPPPGDEVMTIEEASAYRASLASPSPEP
jgi:hypothetical protein